MNKFTKWLSNYWYHYKLRTILCLFLAVVVGVSVFEFATREKYDIKISRLSYGIPMGGDMEYLDPLMISKALDDRKVIS